MERGVEFLKSQVANAILLHRTFVQALTDHADQASDSRLSDLCARYLPKMVEHQHMLEDYQRSVGGTDGPAVAANALLCRTLSYLAQEQMRRKCCSLWPSLPYCSGP